jgi:hypothetical protein
MSIVAPAPAKSARRPDGDGPVRWTLQQFDDAVAARIFPEDASHELIDGLVYRRLVGDAADSFTMNLAHALAVHALNRQAARFEAAGCHLWSQLPVVMPDATLVFPDAAAIRGRPGTDRPVAADVLCLVEVSDASLARDRTLKLERYAGAKIPCYVIVSIPDQQVLVHTRPRKTIYAGIETLLPGDTCRLPTASDATVDVAVDDLLPVAASSDS